MDQLTPQAKKELDIFAVKLKKRLAAKGIDVGSKEAMTPEQKKIFKQEIDRLLKDGYDENNPYEA